MKTRSLFSLLLLFCAGYALKAQALIHGHIADVTHQPAANASILLLRAIDGQLMQSTCADTNGRFEMEYAGTETYYMLIQAAGYERLCTEEVVPLTQSHEKDLGLIVLWKSSAAPVRQNAKHARVRDEFSNACHVR